jgi:hypothetical protein
MMVLRSPFGAGRTNLPPAARVLLCISRPSGAPALSRLLGASDRFNRNGFTRHREATTAALAILNNVNGLKLDCFATLAMTNSPLELKLL